jgi:hypothetical protein
LIPPAQRGVGPSHLARRRWFAHALLASAVVLGLALAIHPPTQQSFYPQCPIHQYLGLECPGCGATRALAALLHGHLAEALRLNALFVLLLPFALAAGLNLYRRALRERIFRWPQPDPRALYATLAIAALFTIARNLH